MMRPNVMERTILHLDLNTFFVSVERLENPKLVGRPVLIGADSDRGVVASCSYEARAFGVRSAMPMKMAKQLCPEAIILRGDSGAYLQKSDEVTEIIRAHVPLFEKSSVDEFYVDLSGTDKFQGSRKLAVELRKRITNESGLPSSFGLSINKTVSKVATGEHGPVLWRKANGIDDSPVVAWHERKSISTERTFERDTIDVVKLKGMLTAMAESLAFQLRKGDKLTSCIAVKIRYADFNTHTKQIRIGYTACDHIARRRYGGEEHRPDGQPF